MNSQTKHIKGILIFCIFSLFLVPLTIQHTTPNTGSSSIISLGQFSVSPSISEARCGTRCKRKKRINRAWNAFTSTAGTSVSPGPEFGGIIAGRILCNGNKKIAFTQLPVAGTGGPYVIDPFSGDLYPNFSVVEGNYELGNAPSDGICRICIHSVCINFNAKEVTSPGMGTS
jgi:hypothetical protein